MADYPSSYISEEAWTQTRDKQSVSRDAYNEEYATSGQYETVFTMRAVLDGISLVFWEEPDRPGTLHAPTGTLTDVGVKSKELRPKGS